MAQYGYFYVDIQGNPTERAAVRRDGKIERIGEIWTLKMNTADNNAVLDTKLEELLEKGGAYFALQTFNGTTGKTHRAQISADELQAILAKLRSATTSMNRLSISVKDKKGIPKEKPTDNMGLTWEEVEV